MGYEVLYALSNSGGGLGHWATHRTATAGATDSITEGRSRGLFPLPMPASCQRLVMGARSSFYSERPRIPSARSKTPFSWLAVLIIAINWLAFGCLSSMPLKTPLATPTSAQAPALDHLTGLCRLFVEPDAEGQAPPRSPSQPFLERVGSKRPDYFGNTVLKAHGLMSAQVQPALPPEGFGGRLWALDGIHGDLQHFVEDARRLLLSEDQLPEDIPHPRVMVESQAESEAIIRLLRGCGIVRIMPDGLIPRVRGRRLLQGAFRVV